MGLPAKQTSRVVGGQVGGGISRCVDVRAVFDALASTGHCVEFIESPSPYILGGRSRETHDGIPVYGEPFMVQQENEQIVIHFEGEGSRIVEEYFGSALEALARIREVYRASDVA